MEMNDFGKFLGLEGKEGWQNGRRATKQKKLVGLACDAGMWY